MTLCFRVCTWVKPGALGLALGYALSLKDAGPGVNPVVSIQREGTRVILCRVWVIERGN